MRTIALTTTAALAAFMLASPTFTPPADAAKVRVNGVKVKPRIRVRPQIKVRINKKRLIRKAATPANQTPQVPEGKQPQNRTTTITTSPGKTPAQRFSTIDPHGPIADALQDAMERFGAGDLNNFDAEDVISLDRFAVGLSLGDDVLDSDKDEGDVNDAIAGLQPPGGRTGSMFDPNDVLPQDNDKPDTSLVAVTPGSIDAARNGIAGTVDVSNDPKTNTTKIVTDDSVIINRTTPTADDRGTVSQREVYDRSDGTVTVLTVVRHPEEGGGTWTRYTDSSRSTVHNSGFISREAANRDPFERYPAAPQSNNSDDNPFRRYDDRVDPDSAGGSVIPVNCGSVACNEARKGKGLRLTGNPHSQVLTPDPAEDTGGTVGNAPYTGKYWRDAATTNPGSEPQDPGDGQPVQTSKTQVLIIDDGTGPKPPTVPGT